LEIREIDGSVGTGPARMVRVRLAPMEVQILGNARVAQRMEMQRADARSLVRTFAL
jgi:hypothetical protein